MPMSWRPSPSAFVPQKLKKKAKERRQDTTRRTAASAPSRSPKESVRARIATPSVLYWLDAPLSRADNTQHRLPWAMLASRHRIVARRSHAEEKGNGREQGSPGLTKTPPGVGGTGRRRPGAQGPPADSRRPSGAGAGRDAARHGREHDRRPLRAPGRRARRDHRTRRAWTEPPPRSPRHPRGPGERGLRPREGARGRGPGEGREGGPETARGLLRRREGLREPRPPRRPRRRLHPDAVALARSHGGGGHGGGEARVR